MSDLFAPFHKAVWRYAVAVEVKAGQGRFNTYKQFRSERISS